jgi:hypothetical protein
VCVSISTDPVCCLGTKQIPHMVMARAFICMFGLYRLAVAILPMYEMCNSAYFHGNEIDLVFFFGVESVNYHFKQ